VIAKNIHCLLITRGSAKEIGGERSVCEAREMQMESERGRVPGSGDQSKGSGDAEEEGRRSPELAGT